MGRCKTCPRADTDTDHTLLRMRFRLKLHKVSKACPKPRYDYSQAEEFRLELQDRLKRADTPVSPDNLTLHSSEAEWQKLKAAVTKTAGKTLSVKGRTSKKEWITPGTFALIEEKRNCPRGGERYQVLKREVQAHLRSDRENHLNGICHEMEELARKNRSKDLFETVTKVTKRACPQVKVVRDANGHTLTEDDEILERWKVYCENLYSGDNETDSPEPDPGPREPIPTLEEVKKALESTGSGKAAGPDELPVELLKLGGDSVVEALHRIIKCVWTTGKWPEDWTQSTFVPLYKKGDPSVCANYRTISLISHASKVLLKVILGRIKPKAELELAEEQAGFRPGRGTHNHLCNLRILTERARARRQPLYMCFVDFEKAFDRVSHKKLWQVLKDMGFAGHIVALIRSLYADQVTNVRIHGRTSGWFKAKRGVRQGCTLSPYLFNLMAELLMRVALDGYDGGFRIGGRCITNLRYADDIVLIASSEEELRNLVNRVNSASADFGMAINVKKTEVMKVSDDPDPVVITVNGETLTETKSFKYLGAQFNSEASCDEEIKARLAIARHRMSELSPIWRAGTVNSGLKARLIQALVWPIVTYGSEAWTLNKELCESIDAFEMQCYRRSMRISYTEHVTNEEVLARVNQSRRLLGQVKSRKLMIMVKPNKKLSNRQLSISQQPSLSENSSEQLYKPHIAINHGSSARFLQPWSHIAVSVIRRTKGQKLSLFPTPSHLPPGSR